MKNTSLIEINKEPEELGRINELFFLGREFPQNVFAKKNDFFLFTSFSYLLSEEFFDKALSEIQLRYSNLRFASLNPNPQYYYDNFNSYGIVNISNTDNYSSFISVLEHVPRLGNVADALLFSSESVGFYSATDNDFAIFGSRFFDIAVIGINNLELKKTLSILLDSKLFHDSSDLFNTLSLAFQNQTLSKEFKDTFSLSYPNCHKSSAQ